MRVLLLTREFPPGRHGGIGAYYAELARSLVGRGHEVVVVTEGASDGQSATTEIRVVRVRPPSVVGARPWAPIDWYLYAREAERVVNRVVQTFPVDVIEASSYGGEAAFYAGSPNRPALVVRIHGLFSTLPVSDRERPLVTSIHNRRSSVPLAARQIYRAATRWPMQRLERHALLSADRLIAPSVHAAHIVQRALPSIPDHEISVIPNGLNLQHSVSVSAQTESLALAPRTADDHLVLFAGRVSYSKGADTLVRAAKIVLNEIPDARFIIAGRIVNADIVRLAERELGERKDRVLFTGALQRTTLEAMYARCALFAFPTLYEISPMAVLEAMRAGKAIVASDTGPLPELVDPGKTGLLLPPRDHLAWADAITELLRDGRRRTEMGRAAQLRAERFGLERMVDDVIAEYQQAIANRGQVR